MAEFSNFVTRPRERARAAPALSLAVPPRCLPLGVSARQNLPEGRKLQWIDLSLSPSLGPWVGGVRYLIAPVEMEEVSGGRQGKREGGGPRSVALSVDEYGACMARP